MDIEKTISYIDQRGHMAHTKKEADGRRHRLVERSIFSREQNGGRRAIGFSYEPNFVASACGVGREDTETVLEGTVGVDHVPSLLTKGSLGFTIGVVPVVNGGCKERCGLETEGYGI